MTGARIGNMNLPKSILPATIACLVLLTGPFASAQAGSPTLPVTRPNQELISIDFPGGPLSKLVASLNTGEQARLSIIQTAGLDPALPAFSVREVRIEPVIVALGRLLAPQGYILEPTGANLAVLSKIPGHRGQAFASLPLGSKVLGGGTNWTVEEIIGAIQAGCEFANADGKPSSLRFKYHPGTQLLFAAGSEQEVDIAHRVFGSLPQLPARNVVPVTDNK